MCECMCVCVYVCVCMCVCMGGIQFNDKKYKYCMINLNRKIFKFINLNVLYKLLCGVINIDTHLYYIILCTILYCIIYYIVLYTILRYILYRHTIPIVREVIYPIYAYLICFYLKFRIVISSNYVNTYCIDNLCTL